MTHHNKSPVLHGALTAALALLLAPSVARAAPDTIIYSFAGGNDGATPRSTLITDSAGNFYGTTNKGGPSNAGTVFKITPGGVESVLYAFTGGSDGGNPSGGPLVMDSLGNLYGTAALGGAATPARYSCCRREAARTCCTPSPTGPTAATPPAG